jgi:hypothetical protein
MASFPSPDYWMPLPATGSGPVVLGRRWTPAASTTWARDCWTSTQHNSLPEPALERHSASAAGLPAQTTPDRTGSHSHETVTLAARSTALPVDQVALPRIVLPTVPVTVTLRPTDSPPQTITRLCVGCGKPLEGKRPQAKAHGVACRQRAYRRRKKEAAQAQGQWENGRDSEPELMALARTTIGAAPG